MSAMVIPNDQVDYLLGLRKEVIGEDGKPLSSLTLNQKYPFHLRVELASSDDNEFSFLWEVKQSDKNSLKISLHFQEDESKIGLLRVDYNSFHQNPMKGKEDLPLRFQPYIGKSFNNESHVHYHVDGYKALAWAVPIEATDFEVQDLSGDNVNQKISDAVEAFARFINISTHITINSLLI